MNFDGSEIRNVRIHEQESGSHCDIPPVDATPGLWIIWILWTHYYLEGILRLFTWTGTVCLMLKLSIDVFAYIGVLGGGVNSDRCL